MSGDSAAKPDRVFRERPDGSLELVGDFDGLYREEEDPWAQSGGDERMGAYYAFSRKNLAEALRRLCPEGRILEVGCGIGYVVDHLSQAVPRASISGLDISRVAIERAQRRFPAYDFRQGDVTAADFVAPRTHDVVVLNQLLWYILAKLDAALAGCGRLLVPGGLLVFSQSFLRDRQRYGADIAEGLHGLVRYLLERHAKDYRLIELHYDDSDRFVHRDGLLVLRRTTEAHQ